MVNDPLTGDFDGQGAVELRSMAAEVPALPQPRAEHGRRRIRIGRRLKRVARSVAYVAAAGVLFFGGWLTRATLDEPVQAPHGQEDQVSGEIMPEKGITLAAHWGELPKRLVEEGVLDLEKFKAAAQAAGMPLTSEQLSLLTEGSDERIKVDSNSAYFLLDVLWALGLANENPILTGGPFTQGNVGSYASTGGWTLGATPGPTYVATLELIQLTPAQQRVVEDVSSNSYRPCCGNMTAFPDCNHGMAALALAELMASQGATSDEIFLTLKQVSPYWFPTQYHHLAVFFEQKGREWDDVLARELMGPEYSSSRGFQQVNAQLQQSGGTGAGAGGGKASGCAP